MHYRDRHLTTRVRHGLAAAAVVLSAGGHPAQAQEAAARDEGWKFAVSVSDVYQSEADLDAGGKLSLSRSALALSARRQLDSGLGIGANLRYSREHWDFSDPIAFGGAAPWRDIHRAGLGVQLRGRIDERWQWIAAPSVQYAGEDGAKSGDAMSYGVALGFARRFSPDLNLAFGVAALRDIDKNRVLPYVAVNWKIDEHWRLGTPEAALPSALGGIELIYRRDAAWEFGAGLGTSQYRFRLDAHGPTAGGVGESRSLPLYGRVSYRATPRVRFDAYAGASFANRVRVERADGVHTSEDYDTAPMIGLAVIISP